MNGVTTRQVRGLVTELDISGWLKGSAQLEFVISPQVGPTETLLVNSDAEPQFFASATTILLAAYHSKTPVEVTIRSDQPQNETQKISGVKVPAY